ncbi:Rossmann-like fold-containing protein [Motilimonas cestriensis]|uniref:Rossmann-like fold-containing protein n=1 Tax=Motilimonas cestriensis TaxID=2742685 RepID=UPI003DA6152F
MFLDPSWRVLVVGDGDFSFSAALAEHFPPRYLCATIYDSVATLASKYGEQYRLQLLQAQTSFPVQVLTEFDVTDPQQWQTLAANHQQFDLIIFQFPLVPGFTSKAEFEAHGRIDSNLRNRRLLHQFLLHSQKFGLNPDGAGLIYISSKEVKPYSEWDIEHSLHLKTDLQFLGKMPFSFEQFPGYQMRNVDRDKFVRDTASFTYVWQLDLCLEAIPAALAISLQANAPEIETDLPYCELCQAGPFHSQQEQRDHHASKRHLKMQGFHQRWLEDLGLFEAEVNE